NNATGGHIVWPGSGGSQTSLAMANTSQGAYEFMVLQYDGSGIFRVLEATPATAQAIGMVGAAGISHWSFPTVSSYTATVADNGNVISSLNSSASYLAVTLPSTTAVPMGWTIGIATDGNKTAAVQTNSTSGGRILYPGSGATTTSASLAGANYELLVLQFDGGNFRVIQATPATVNYEFVALQFDGSNFRIVSITPRSASALGMLGHQITTGTTPALGSGASDCGTSPSIGGNDSAGRVTVGSANGGSCTITF